MIPISSRKAVIIVSIILVFLVPGASIKVQAQTDNAPECTLAAVRDFKIVVGPGATIEVQRGQSFLGKLYPNLVRININGVWFEVSRNDVMLISWNVPSQ
jgi:hypothetical protein